MTTDYVPREVPGCCSGYGRPSEGHDINPPCATVVERQEFEKAVREAQARALEEAADAEADWTSSAWRSSEAETVAKLRKGLRRRAASIRGGASA